MSRPKCTPCHKCAVCYASRADAVDEIAKIQRRMDALSGRIDANISRASDPVGEARKRMIAAYGRSDDERQTEGQGRKPAPSAPKGQGTGQRPDPDAARKRMISAYGKRPEGEK